MAGEAEVSVKDCDTCRSNDSAIAEPATVIGLGKLTVVVPVPCPHNPSSKIEVVILELTKVTFVKEQSATVTVADVYMPCGRLTVGRGSEAPFKCFHSTCVPDWFALVKTVIDLPALLVRAMLDMNISNLTS